MTYSGSYEELDPEGSEPAPTGPSTTAGSDPTSETSSTAEDAGLPSWLAPVLVVLVFGAAGATAVVRRRRA